MIKTIEARYFRKHEDLSLNFTSGLNVLRGPNEVGKTTITEIILYCYFGAAALVDKLEEVVTWGQRDTALKAKMVCSISGIDYAFSRSKAGAEVTYAGEDGNVVRVTGQKEVTNFAAGLLGADAKTASVLMLSSQAGLRGALDEGATAVGALMAKLADFDTIDKLLENASATLALGSIVPVQEKLAAADLEVLAAQQALIDPATFAALDESIEKAAATHAELAAADAGLTQALTQADVARDAARSNNTSVEAANLKVSEITTAIRLETGRLDAAMSEAAKRPDPAAIGAARAELESARGHAQTAKAYAEFLALPTYPDLSWDDTQESFEAALAECSTKAQAAGMAARDLETQYNNEKRNLMVPGAPCRSCGHKSDDPAHMAEHNAAVNARLTEINAKAVVAGHASAEAINEFNEMKAVQQGARTLHDGYVHLHDRLLYDKSVYPWKAAWRGEVPGAAPDVSALQRTIATLEGQERSATQAEGRAAAHRATLVDHQAALARAQAVFDGLKAIDLAPLEEVYNAAFAAYSANATRCRELGFALEDLKAQKAAGERQVAEAQQRLVNAQARVAEYVADIKTLEFNNELVRKLKSMKPMITDFLWNQVLAAVGNYFTALRGEQSIVTKDASGFKVNGRGGSLSGSTLDVLALAIRVALSKTFVPHASFMVLDEPAHGADAVRTGNILGFLSGVGFQQTILASHDELSESVADNVINLGE